MCDCDTCLPITRVNNCYQYGIEDSFIEKVDCLVWSFTHFKAALL